MSDLLDAVDDLTKPQRQKFMQDTVDGGTVMVTVCQGSLLEQLDAAIRSNMGGTTAGSSDPATRSLANAAALMKMMQISSVIIDWARIHGAPITKGSPQTTLRAWYVTFNGSPHSPEIRAEHTKQLRRWAVQINAVLDPPREKDLPDACPLCGATEWWDPANGDKYSRPLVIRYRPADDGLVRDATGHCRACAKVWNARELAYEIEVADTARRAVTDDLRSA